jgi:Flp pilus assembly protein TadG
MTVGRWKGQGLVEFTVVILLLLFLSGGLLAIAPPITYKGAVDDAAKAAGHAASTWRSTDGVSCLQAANSAAQSATIYHVALSLSDNSTSNDYMNRGDLVSASAKIDYSPIFFDTLGNPPMPLVFTLEGYAEFSHW